MDLALTGMTQAREAIDALNVYPVPDGDTGTNLHLTLRRAVQEARQCQDDTVAALLAALAHGALLGARGNSGIIVSQLLRGWAEAFADAHSADPWLLARGLARADEQAWAAVETPVEGTILSVTRAAALAAGQAAQDGGDLAGVVRAAAAAAHQALAKTTEQLPVLAEAGVVDAGGAGCVVMLDALVSAVCGLEAPPLPTAVVGPIPRVQRCPQLAVGGPAFEVMYLLTVDDERVDTVRSMLANLGDSLVVVGGSKLWHVHLHTDDPGGAIEVGVRVGVPHRIRIIHLPSGDPRVEAEPVGGGSGRGLGAVAWAAGPGLASVFTRAGAVAVTSDSGARVSTEEVLGAIRRTGAAEVVLMPNDTDTVAVARAAAAAARDERIDVVVLPTRAQVQGLAAVAVLDPHAALDEAVESMTAAAAATRHAAVSVASRPAMTLAGPCRPGDVLGLVAGEITRVGDDITAMALLVLDDLLEETSELVTVVLGGQAPDGVADSIRGAVPEGIEVQVLDGGQPAYPLLIGVE
jgi:DAK2 domain fusion protein YloV